MKFLKIPFFVLITLSVISCSDITENNPGEISVWSANYQLKIFNESNQTIYLFIVEQNYAALIDWIPGYSGLNIKAGGSISVNFEDISNGKSTPVKPGDTIIIYHWKKAGNKNPQVQNKVVEL